MKISVLFPTLLLSVHFIGSAVYTPQASAAGCPHPEFAGARAYSSHSYPYGLAVFDFDSDNHADVASVSFGSNIVTVSFGLGDGTFQSNTDYSAIEDADHVYVRDMNTDGKPDLVVFSGLLQQTFVLLGNGNGTFQSGTNLSGIGGYSIAIGDLNGDGTNDVVLGGSPLLSVELGKGNLTYSNSATFNISEACTAVEIADMNADGIPDIVVGGSASGTADLFVLLGTGNGNFLSPTNSQASTDNDALAIGDFDNDGTNDVAVLNNVAGLVSIFLSNGNGTLHIRDFKLTGNTGPILSSIRAVDLNHDGNMDVVVGDYQTIVMLGNGDGTLQTPIKYYNSSSALAATGDFDEDGNPDVLIGVGGLEGQPNLRLLLGNGDGTLQEVPGYPTSHGPTSPKLGDFNGDNMLDIVVANAFSNSISVLLNKGDGTYSNSVNYTAGSTPVSIAVGDFHNNGKLDLIVANQNSADILFYSGNGNGTFQAPTVAGTVVIGSFAVVAGDFNNDGKLDFAASGLSPTTFTAGVMVFRGNGNGTFQAPGSPAGTAFLLDSIASGHFNSDTNLDVVYTKFGSNIVSVILGNGSGGFGTNVNYTVGTNVQAVAVADLNNDGKLDLVTANYGCSDCGSVPDLNFRGSISVLKGNGNGTFQAASNYVVNIKGTLVGVATGDFNGDGKVDVAVSDTTYGLGTVNILLGNGDLTFQPPFAFTVQNTPNQPAVGDVNGDGRLDIVVANQAVDTVSVLLNTCSAITNSAQPDLAITKTDSPDPVLVDSNLTYTIIVRNLGTATAANVTVTDALPSSVTFVSASAGCINIGGNVICNDGTITIGSAKTNTIIVSPTTIGIFTNDAVVSSSTADSDSSNNSTEAVTTATLIATDLTVTKTASPDPVGTGSNLTYTVTVTNNGPAAATGVMLTDSLPSGTTFVSASSGCTNNSGTVICGLGDLGNGASTSIDIVVTTTTAGSITNTASVVSNEADPVTGNNTATAVTTVQQSGGGGGASLVGTLSKVKEKCKTKNNVTTCKLGAGLALLNNGATEAPATHVRFFLSTDTNYNDGVDTLLGEATTKTIKPGKAGKGKLKAGTGASSAGLFILAVDDDGNVLASFQVPAV